MEATRQNEIQDPFQSRPHVVVLGAGASIAALPDGDRNGKRLPDMRSLASVPEIHDLLATAGVEDPVDNFENAYAVIRGDDATDRIADQIEDAVRAYFADIKIVDTPTIYDHLLLGLRPKDLIATFNWDPLIVQAEDRLRRRGFRDLPRVAFLHGNVAISVCLTDEIAAHGGGPCPDCGKPMEPVPLLYPVTDKDYADDGYIQDAWDGLRWGLKNGVVVTVFGYRAPQSDRAAIAEFQQAWGTPEERQFEQFEVIGRPGKDREELRATWDTFIHTHHYRTCHDFFDSWIANHPRRSAEAWYRQHIQGKFIDVNPVPRNRDLEATIDWYRALTHYERGD
jgi:hypothetical protein